jgi:DMSO/TMAO reductase YedYZ heme-binding membrane subunit
MRFGRRVVYALVLLWAFGLYYYASSYMPTTSSALKWLMREYGLTALFLLYGVLTPGLVLTFFPSWKYTTFLVHIRRSLGVSVFFFVLLHGTIGFFHNLSGTITSILFLSARNQWALAFSATAFCIYAALAITSFDSMVKKLGARWKMLHRLVYVAALLSVFHAFFIGSHFTVPTNPIPVIVNILSFLFIILEVVATVKRRWMKEPEWTKGNTLLFSFLAAVLVFACVSSYIGFTTRYDPHAAHRKGYSRDYVMDVQTSPSQIVAGQPVTMKFKITDKRTGRPLTRYQVLQEKLMHVVVLRQDLNSYAHIHPEHDGGDTFTVVHTFPTDGTYGLFVEYSPPDFYENLSIAQVRVGSTNLSSPASLSVDNRSKVFEDAYRVTLTVPETIRVNDTVDVTLTLTDEKTGEPIVDLETYLGAFGHMSAASEDMQAYTHVHPLTVPLVPSDLGGPSVQFSTFFPKPGKYKLFTQFQHKGKVFVTDFVVEAK